MPYNICSTVKRDINTLSTSLILFFLGALLGTRANSKQQTAKCCIITWWKTLLWAHRSFWCLQNSLNCCGQNRREDIEGQIFRKWLQVSPNAYDGFRLSSSSKVLWHGKRFFVNVRTGPPSACSTVYDWKKRIKLLTIVK